MRQRGFARWHNRVRDAVAETYRVFIRVQQLAKESAITGDELGAHFQLFYQHGVGSTLTTYPFSSGNTRKNN
jgi:hypothetical protein